MQLQRILTLPAGADAEQTRVVVVEVPVAAGTPVPDSAPRAMAVI